MYNYILLFIICVYRGVILKIKIKSLITYVLCYIIITLEGGFLRTIFIEHLSEKRKYVSDIVNEIFEKDSRFRGKIKK